MPPHLDPRPLSPASVLTVREAVRELKLRRDDGIAWLNEHGLVRDVAGRQRVIWGDVLDAIRGRAHGSSEPVELKVQAVRRLPLSRSI